MPVLRPPEGLDVKARDVWLDVVDNLPADWFEPVMLPVLEQYWVKSHSQLKLIGPRSLVRLSAEHSVRCRDSDLCSVLA